MPGGMEGIIQDIRQRQLSGSRNQDMMARQLMMQQLIDQRMKEQAALKLQNMNQSPYLKLRQQKQADDQAKQKAFVDAVMMLTPNEVPPEWRDRLKDVQHYLANNPNGALAEKILNQAKPHGYKLVQSQTVDADGNPITSYEIGDVDAGTLSPVRATGGLAGASSTPATGPAVGVRPSAAAGPTSRSLGGAAEHFYGKHFGVDDGDDAGGP
jgi:hypothetical protein